MTRLRRNLISLALAMVLCAAPALAAAAVPAGQVTMLTGRATAVGTDGSIRALAKDDRVFEGELINTGPSSYLNMEFRDNSRILLRPNTRFEIEEFSYRAPAAGAPQTEITSSSDREDTAFFRLIKGGFRAVTGAVGKRQNNRYQVRTPVATIGIRGTDYEARLCAGDCLDIDPPPSDGLYAGVNSGSIAVGNDTQVVERAPGQFLFVAAEGEFVPLDEAPKILTADPIPNPEDCN